MSRWPPSIANTYAKPDGSVRLEWTLDQTFPSPEEPHEIHVDLLTGARLTATDPLAGTARSYDVAADVVEAWREMLRAAGRRGTLFLEGQVVFVWRGQPGESLTSPFSVPLPPTPEEAKEEPPKQEPSHDRRVPRLTVTGRHPKTLHGANRITLDWSAWNFNAGLLHWGHASQPRAFQHKLVPRRVPGDVVYAGTFATTSPLASGATYRFRAEVKNTHEGWEFVTEIEVVAATNFGSVRDFLQASGVSSPTVELRAYLGTHSGLRSLLGL